MKTKRRHELQTNTLADSLAHVIETVKPYSRVILGVMLAAVVLGCTYAFLSAQAAERQDKAWADYIEAMVRDPLTMDINRKKLTDLAENAGTTRAGEWARLTLADIDLRDGLDQLFTDKVEGTQKLQQAVELYQNALGDRRESPLRPDALLGLARANEALGELDAAAENYRKLYSEFPESPFSAEAQRREEDLKASSTKRFYDWFVKYEPEKKAAALEGTPGSRPPFDKATEDELKGDKPFPPSDFEKKFPTGGEAGEKDSEKKKADKDGPAADGDQSPEGKDEPSEKKPAASDEKSAEPAEKSASPVEKPEAPAEKPAASDPGSGDEAPIKSK